MRIAKYWQFRAPTQHPGRDSAPVALRTFADSSPTALTAGRVTLINVNNWEERASAAARDHEAGRQVARAVAEREQGRRRLNATTVTVSLASVAVAGVVAVILPGVQPRGRTSTGSKLVVQFKLVQRLDVRLGH